MINLKSSINSKLVGSQNNFEFYKNVYRKRVRDKIKF